MKTFTIYPDKARALGNVMNNNSQVEDMVEFNSLVRPLVDENHPFTDDLGNVYNPPETVGYDSLAFPIFEMGVLSSIYDTSLTLNVSSDSCYVGDSITITATLRDNNNDLLDGSISFKCGNDFITNGNNTGGASTYADTTNGVVSFNYSFDSLGEYTIVAESVATNMHSSAKSSENIVVYKKPVTIDVSGINSTTTYVEDMPFTVELSSNNQPVTGLEYSITLDGESFDTGTSTANGESYTLSNLEKGTHTVVIYYPGNNVYESASRTIEFFDGKIPEVSISWTQTSKDTTNRTANGTLSVEVYNENNPVVDMPLAIQVLGPSPFNSGVNINDYTDSQGKWSLPATGWPYGNYTFTVTTSAYGDFSATEKSISIIIS